MLNAGTLAPPFTLKDKDGKLVSLSDFKGKRVCLYFYPKDNTPGCTKEACSLEERRLEIESKNCVIIGISRDKAESHEKFASKYGLNFILLSDPDHSVSSSYGAWGEKMMYGKKTEGMIRSTFIIDESGTISHVFKKVKVAEHGDEVLAVL